MKTIKTITICALTALAICGCSKTETEKPHVFPCGALGRLRRMDGTVQKIEIYSIRKTDYGMLEVETFSSNRADTFFTEPIIVESKNLEIDTDLKAR